MSGKYKKILQRYNLFAHILKYDMRQIHRQPMIYYSFINKATHQLSCDNINSFSIILRRVMAKQAVAFLEKILKKVEELCASGQCAAAIVPLQFAINLGHLPSRALLAHLLMEGREGVAKDENGAVSLCSANCIIPKQLGYLGGITVKQLVFIGFLQHKAWMKHRILSATCITMAFAFL